MGKLSERMNGLEKDVMKTLMDFLPSGVFSTMGTMGTDEEKSMKSVMDMAVNTLAYCEEASEALDKIEELEEKLDDVLARQAKLEKLLTILVGQNKELDTRFDGLEEAVRELTDDKTLPKRATKKVEKEE